MPWSLQTSVTGRCMNPIHNVAQLHGVAPASWCGERRSQWSTMNCPPKLACPPLWAGQPRVRVCPPLACFGRGLTLVLTASALMQIGNFPPSCSPHLKRLSSRERELRRVIFSTRNQQPLWDTDIEKDKSEKGIQRIGKEQKIQETTLVLELKLVEKETAMMWLQRCQRLLRRHW